MGLWVIFHWYGLHWEEKAGVGTESSDVHSLEHKSLVSLICMYDKTCSYIEQ